MEPARKLTKMIGVVVPNEVAHSIENEAGKSGIKVSDWCRRALTEKLKELGYEIDTKMNIGRGKRNDLKTPQGREKMIENMRKARDVRDRDRLLREGHSEELVRVIFITRENTEKKIGRLLTGAEWKECQRQLIEADQELQEEIRRSTEAYVRSRALRALEEAEKDLRQSSAA